MREFQGTAVVVTAKRHGRRIDIRRNTVCIRMI